MKEDYYEILGLSKGASAGEIKKPTAKRPLNSIQIKTQETKRQKLIFKKAAEAYEILSDPQKSLNTTSTVMQHLNLAVLGLAV